MKRKVLLIAFKFPPYAGVGGFRWAKLCKYLARIGHEIHVVTVHWKQLAPDTLYEDVQRPNIHIHWIPSGYPHNFKYRRMQNRYLNALKVRGLFLLDRAFFYDDEAQHWGRYLLPYCEQLLQKESLDTIIATGHPFQANRWAAIIKQRHPPIKLIQDFRDPWTDDPFHFLPESKKPLVRAWQNLAVEAADCLVAVTQGLLALYLDTSQQKQGVVIRNGYDPESFKAETRRQPRIAQNPGLSFIHIGNLLSGRQRPLIQFLRAVQKVSPEIPGIRITLVGGYEKRQLEQEFSSLIQKGILTLIPHIPQQQALKMARQYAYALQFNAKDYPYALSTKIYEYGMLKAPTVSINYGGEIHDLILKHDLGYSLHVERDDLVAFLWRLWRQPPPQFRFHVEPFAYDKLAAQYSELISHV